MASSFLVTLDTVAPAAPAIVLNGGATTAFSVDVTAGISTSDSPTTGYQMKIWGDVDEANDPNVQEDEVDSAWIAFSATKAIRLAAGSGTRIVHARIRDDVWNESAQVSDTIELDTTLPVVTIIGGPDTDFVSTTAGKRMVYIQWESNDDFQAYEVAVVSDSAALRGTGTVIPTANGSVNTVGGSGLAGESIVTGIEGRDLAVASPGEGNKVIKVFVQDLNGSWSET